MRERKQKKKYKISLTTAPPKQQYTDEEVKKIVNKALSLIINELLVNGHIILLERNK
jgi:phenylalanyl-tRNA synthetase beta subunit